MKIYFAYGANTSFANMNRRCPGAKYICNVTLHHFKLVMRGVADMKEQRGAKVQGALWLISPENEAALDGFEGFPRSYVKRYVTMRLNGKRYRVMFYVMRQANWQDEPSEAYEAVLRSGYADCGLSELQLDNAISRAMAWREQHPEVAGRKSNWDRNKTEGAAKPAVNDDEAAADAADQTVAEFYNQQLMMGDEA
jgi:gamma-glutamylcyclotransferase (GGCT)/AIG2-like uncharacterized protein YtfP